MADADISLRPVGLGSGNPFSGFGKGAGFGIKAKKVAAVTAHEETAAKKSGKRIKYGKEFLMQFMERYAKCPLEVQQLGLTEIVISEESERDQQRQVLQKVAEEIDDRDWRTRDAAPAATTSPNASKATAQLNRDANWEKTKEQQQQQQADGPAVSAEARPAAAAGAAQPTTTQPAQPAAAVASTTGQPAAANAGEAPKIVRAADVGLQAYRPGAQLSSEERALRTIKGILNKLTPEKFERLLQQLLEVITTADILKHTITLVFENAVEQPTYCAMYADLCLRLSKELPSFPPPSGSDKAISFRQILLNTCQDEFEGTEAAREALGKVTEPAQREDAERTVKKRTMGNMRLISELYKHDMVKDWIMTACMEDLLNAPKGKVPPEDNIEAACEMITTAGGRLSKSDRAETRKKLDDVLRTLEKLGADSRNVASRIRFVIKDILDLKRNSWVPRRELFTAKKLDEVRAQAEAELGMISSNITAVLPTLPAQQRMGMGIVEDVPLIPPLRSNGRESEGWGLFPPLRSQPAGAAGGQAAGRSALLGDFQPVGTPAQEAVPAQAAPAPAAAAPKASAGAGLSEEELKRKTEGLLQEYSSTLDKKEALLCVQELQSPDWMPKFVETALEQILNSTRDKEQVAFMELLLHLHAAEAITSTDIISALTTYAAQLEDLSMDFPKAPQHLGHFIGLAVNASVVSLDALPALLEGDYGVEPKRNLAAAAFKAIQSEGGAEKLGQLCQEADLHADSFLKADPEFDGDAPSVEDWLTSNGFTTVPV